MKLNLNWQHGTIIAFITALLIPIFMISTPILSRISIYAVNAMIIIILGMFLALAILSRNRANRFQADIDARATYKTLKRINLASAMLFAIHIMGTLTHVILIEELKRFPPHWGFILNHTELCTHYVMLFPKMLPGLTLIMFIVSCLWPLSTVFFKSKS